MKILVAGPADHPQSFAVSAAKAFRAIGLEASLFDYRAAARPFARNLPGPRWVRYPLQTFANAQLIKRVDEENPDLVFIIKGELLFPETVQRLREMCYVVKWFPDDPLHFDDSISTAPFCDILLTSSRPLVSDYRVLGARVVRFWPFPVDTEFLRPTDVPPEDRHEVVFVGDATGPRASVLGQVRDHDLAVYGPGWNKVAGNLPGRAWHQERLHGDRLGRILAGSDIVVSMPRSIMGIHPRPFEAAACGSFCLSVSAEGLEEFFEPEKEIVLFRNSQEFAREAAYYLEAPEERRAIADRARERALREYAYDRWALKLLGLVAENPREL